jgi:hypothetical protein
MSLSSHTQTLPVPPMLLTCISCVSVGCCDTKSDSCSTAQHNICLLSEPSNSRGSWQAKAAQKDFLKMPCSWLRAAARQSCCCVAPALTTSQLLALNTHQG